MGVFSPEQHHVMPDGRHNPELDPRRDELEFTEEQITQFMGENEIQDRATAIQLMRVKAQQEEESDQTTIH